MLQKRAKAGKKIPPTPGFELQVSQCLVRATLSSPPGRMDFLTETQSIYSIAALQCPALKVCSNMCFISRSYLNRKEIIAFSAVMSK